MCRVRMPEQESERKRSSSLFPSFFLSSRRRLASDDGLRSPRCMYRILVGGMLRNIHQIRNFSDTFNRFRCNILASVLYFF